MLTIFLPLLHEFLIIVPYIYLHISVLLTNFSTFLINKKKTSPRQYLDIENYDYVFYRVILIEFLAVDHERLTKTC
jgi:hypothetical protein